MQSTEWRPIPGYEGIYEVSDSGGIRSLDRHVNWGDRELFRRGRIIQASKNRNGRWCVRLTDADGVRGFAYIHRLVLLTFLGPCPAGMEACHSDDDPDNNHISNLRWDTRSANMQDRIRNGRHYSSNKTHCPYGHVLEHPNLMQSLLRDKGFRSCRACNLALQHGVYRKTGFDADVADAKYAEIMSGTNPTRPKRKQRRSALL